VADLLDHLKAVLSDRYPVEREQSPDFDNRLTPPRTQVLFHAEIRSAGAAGALHADRPSRRHAKGHRRTVSIAR
jgi:hypothetical protein